VGIGPGAHGRLTLKDGAVATRQIKAPSLWLKRVAAEGHGTQEREAINAHARAEELLMMGLRLTEGVHVERFERLCGLPLSSLLNTAKLQQLSSQGFLAQKNNRLMATATGRLALNEVLRQVLAT